MHWTMGIKIALVLIVVLVVAYFLYKYFSKPTKAPYQQSSSSSSSNSKDVEVLYFFTNWCPYCKTATPEVQAVIDQLNNTQINGYTVIFQQIDCSTENAENEQLINTYHVDSYPTIKLVKGSEVIDYDAKPDKDTLIQFINTSLS